MKQAFKTKRFEETQKIGFDIAQNLAGKNVLALYGNLGSGKTTFVQGLAKNLGIEQKIISPTFIIVRRYEIPINSTIQQFNNFYHIDLYRIENKKDLDGLGLGEILNDQSNLVAIEWPEKIDKLLPNNTIKFYFEYLGDDKRQIIIR